MRLPLRDFEVKDSENTSLRNFDLGRCGKGKAGRLIGLEAGLCTQGARLTMRLYMVQNPLFGGPIPAFVGLTPTSILYLQIFNGLVVNIID